MKSSGKEVAERLRAPFAPKWVQWRVGSVSVRNRKVQLLAYIDARAVAQRLDEVFGPLGWSCRHGIHSQGVTCTIEAGGAVREDGAQYTDIESFKGGLSDAFKRAAVRFGIGAYLYDLDSPWVEVRERGAIRVYSKDRKTGDVLQGYVDPPPLPAWALPSKPKPSPSPLPADHEGETSLERQLATFGLTLEQVNAFQAARGKPPVDEMALPDQESMMGWLRGKDNRERVAETAEEYLARMLG